VGPYFLREPTRYARGRRCVSPERAFDGLIDRPIAPYLFIFHRVLAPGAISSLSLSLSLSLAAYADERRGGGGRKYIRGPHAHPFRVRVALYQFSLPLSLPLSLSLSLSLSFFSVGTATKSLPKPIDCHIPAGRKNEPANVPGLLTRASAEARETFEQGK